VPERDTRDTTHIAQDALVRAISIYAFLVECPSVPASGLPSPVVSAGFSMFSLSFLYLMPSEGAGRAMRIFSLMIVHSAEAYLLAAMPQSSSPSAMESLGRLSCRNAISPPDSEKACSRCKPQRRPGPNSWQSPFQPPPDCRTDPVWGQLERQHSHVCQLPDILLQRYASDNTTIYKDHVLPTPRSVAALRAARLPVLVMLREPAGSLHGWCEKKRHERRQVGCAHGMCTPTRHAHPRHTTCPHMHTACTRLYV
jgi:hypothetical protein